MQDRDYFEDYDLYILPEDSANEVKRPDPYFLEAKKELRNFSTIIGGLFFI